MTSASDDERVDFALEQDFREAVGRLFARVETQLRALLPGCDIQHVGSTAIPGSLTKGDLDVQVRVTADTYAAAKEALSKLYRINVGGFATEDATSFEDYSTQPSLGVHLTVIDGSADIQWRFRDLLLASAALRDEYDQLKRRFDGGSMTKYRDEKATFVERVLRDAGVEHAMVSTTRYSDIVSQLRSAYDGSAAERDAIIKEDWKLEERQAFLQRLRREGRTRLLEVGAGTGQDSLYFKEHGISVVATDLSAQMVARCRAKGLEAHVMDFLQLDFPPHSFDAGYAFNCLLHVANADLPDVLAAIHKVLKPGGLFYAGLYGGETFEGVWPDDRHNPPRFFSIRTDDQMRGFVEPLFEVLDFHVVRGDVRFQALTLRVPEQRARRGASRKPRSHLARY